MCPPCLRSIHGIEGLVKEEAYGPGQIDPRRTVGVEAGIVPKHGQDIDNHKTKAGKGNLSRRISTGRLLTPKYIQDLACKKSQ
jgi:hypothetical protein